MLFTTTSFVLLYLPIVVVGFFLIGRHSPTWAASWLFLASMFFYGYWMPQYTLLLLASISVNFYVGVRIAELVRTDQRRTARFWLTAGIVTNLALLGYFKYFNFVIASLNAALGLNLTFAMVTLPIGISFFTFTQIAFLADAYQKDLREYRFPHYGLFVSYFPHLVAGPVLHHAQMMPQFGQASTYRFNSANFCAGCAIFCLGLVKKVIIADGISPYSDVAFDNADNGIMPTSAEAWLAAFAYTFQLYFDFSGYSDMAIGLSWMLNIRLPYNFDSPYKAVNISDFWRRWHISLSNFLRDYLYIPLGGNRVGVARRYINLALTMLLGGLWHGASWTFVVWGGLHGLYLCIHHLYRALLLPLRPLPTLLERAIYRGVTFLAVVLAWVFFRAATFDGAGMMLSAMADIDALFVHDAVQVLWWNEGLSGMSGTVSCVILGAVCWWLPNSNAIGEAIHEQCRAREGLRHALGGAAIVLTLLLIVINAYRASVSSFIYFNF